MLVGVGARLVPLLLKPVLRYAAAGEDIRQLRQLVQLGRVLGVLGRPLLPGHVLPHLGLDGLEGGVGHQPVCVLPAKLLVAGRLRQVVLRVRARRARRARRASRLRVPVNKVRVAREGRKPRVGGAKLVCGVNRQHLPVGLAALRQVVHELLAGLAKRAALAAVGHGGNVAQHAHAALHGLLQTLLLVEVQHGGAQRPQEHVGLAVLDLGLYALHDVVHVLAQHGQVQVLGVGEAPVGQHRHHVVAVAAREAKHVLVQREGLEVALGKEVRQGLAHGNCVAVNGAAVQVLLAPGVGAAVVGVRVALHAGLVPVVNAGHAGHGHLQQGRHPQAAHGKAALVGVQAVGAALLVGEGVLVGRAAQHGQHALAVVAAQQVQAGVEGLRRVVLVQGLHGVGVVLRGGLLGQEAQRGDAERVVHGPVQLLALQVLAQLAVAHLVGGVLPHLANEQGVRLLGQGGLLDGGNEVVRQLVRNVQAPAAGTQAQPLAHHAVLAANELAVGGVVLVHVGQVVHAPPALVLVPVLGRELVPAAIRRIVALVGALLRVVAVAVEVAGVAPRVVEDAVQNDANAQLRRGGA